MARYSIGLVLYIVLIHAGIIPGNLFAQEYNYVYPEELCQNLTQDPDILLLDVRSADEFADTSQMGIMNIGRFTKAINIDVAGLESRIAELEPYMDKKIFVYCSHSNRSRKACKLLSGKGFKNIYNINGGITEWILEDLGCTANLYSNSLKYKLYSPAKVKEMIPKNSTLIVDIRTKEEYDGISSDGIRNTGILMNSINIPYDKLEERLQEMDKSKDIILYDFDCEFSPNAADLLIQRGFTSVGIMVFGISTWINQTPSYENTLMKNFPAYKNLSIKESIDKIRDKNDNLVFLDVRPDDEFNNKAEDTWKNMGHLKNAIHIPAEEFAKRIGETINFKNKEILVYGNYPNRSADVCKILVQNGFKNVNDIYCGIGKLIWAKNNLRGFSFPDDLIIN